MAMTCRHCLHSGCLSMPGCNRCCEAAELLQEHWTEVCLDGLPLQDHVLAPRYSAAAARLYICCKRSVCHRIVACLRKGPA